MQHYKAHKRALPWRSTRDPYKILVSEIMLQQTQTYRVEPKYKIFIKQFPTVHALAIASKKDLLHAWQGLGYNRRALNLQQAAQIIKDEYRGKIPDAYSELIKLPGIGPYTAGAICAFAFNKPETCIETNIRTAYLHHFFPNTTNVPDKDILPLITQSLDRKNPREWYWALMDYGAHLKATKGNANIRSKHYARQSPFKGSLRATRGALLKLLITRPLSHSAILKELANYQNVDHALQQLTHEGFITRNKKTYAIA